MRIKAICKMLTFVTAMTFLLSYPGERNILVEDTYKSHTFSGLKNIHGVGDYGRNTMYYYIDPSAIGMEQEITASMNDWVDATDVITPIYFKRTYEKPKSVIDIYVDEHDTTLKDRHCFGITMFFEDSTTITDGGDGRPAENWSRNEIWLKPRSYIAKQAETMGWTALDSNTLKGIVAHEIRHCLGLAHPTNLQDYNLIMATYDKRVDAYGVPITSCTPSDIRHINYLYK